MASEQLVMQEYADLQRIPEGTQVKRDLGSLIPDASPEPRVVEPGDDFQTVRIDGRLWYVTPKDPVTGVVYPILQHEKLPIDNPDRANLHHGNHPASDPSVSYTTFHGAALRNGQLQLVNVHDHNEIDPRTDRPVYHDYFYGPIPEYRENEVFRTIVAAVAGDIPHYAIDMRAPNGPQVVPLEGKSRELLLTLAKPQTARERRITNLPFKAGYKYDELQNPTLSKEEYIARFKQAYWDRRAVNNGFAYRYIGYRYEPVRSFFQYYVFKQKIDMEKEVDEFLCTDDQARRIFLGNLLIAKAVEAAADIANDVFKVAKQRSGLRPVYEGSRPLVRDVLGRTATHRGELAESYAQKLRVEYGLAA
ncbi:MAG TPA: hypothetical protein VF401_02180 [Candidatus Saccharimonadales bacterium]